MVFFKHVSTLGLFCLFALILLGFILECFARRTFRALLPGLLRAKTAVQAIRQIASCTTAKKIGYSVHSG